MSSTTGGRTRGRFVPTLTEVVTPVVLEAAQAVEPAAGAQGAPMAQRHGAVAVEGPPTPEEEAPLRMGSALEAAVEALLPQARVQLQVALQATADALVAQQLQAMEEQLRAQLRATVRQAMGLGRSDAP